MTQNDILRRIRYILDLDDSKMISTFSLPGHKYHRACKDQVLRNFLKGLQLKYRSPYENRPLTPAV